MGGGSGTGDEGGGGGEEVGLRWRGLGSQLRRRPNPLRWSANRSEQQRKIFVFVFSAVIGEAEHLEGESGPAVAGGLGFRAVRPPISAGYVCQRRCRNWRASARSLEQQLERQLSASYVQATSPHPWTLFSFKAHARSLPPTPRLGLLFTACAPLALCSAPRPRCKWSPPPPPPPSSL